MFRLLCQEISLQAFPSAENAPDQWYSFKLPMKGRKLTSVHLFLLIAILAGMVVSWRVLGTIKLSTGNEIEQPFDRSRWLRANDMSTTDNDRYRMRSAAAELAGRLRTKEDVTALLGLPQDSLAGEPLETDLQVNGIPPTSSLGQRIDCVDRYSLGCELELLTNELWRHWLEIAYAHERVVRVWISTL